MNEEIFNIHIHNGNPNGADLAELLKSLEAPNTGRLLESLMELKQERDGEYPIGEAFTKLATYIDKALIQIVATLAAIERPTNVDSQPRDAIVKLVEN